MRRDMDLVRAILVNAEGVDGPYDALQLVNGQWTAQSVAYHVELMAAHGLVDASVRRGGEVVVSARVEALTWDGCDYLDAIRNDIIWEQTKRRVLETVGSTTLDLVKAVAVAMTKTALGI